MVDPPRFGAYKQIQYVDDGVQGDGKVVEVIVIMVDVAVDEGPVEEGDGEAEVHIQIEEEPVGLVQGVHLTVDNDQAIFECVKYF